jgi:hypothetical protein
VVEDKGIRAAHTQVQAVEMEALQDMAGLVLALRDTLVMAEPE